MPLPTATAPGGMPPAEMQQLLQLMIQRNPELLASLLASKGVQPPSDAGALSNVGAGPTGTTALGSLVMPQGGAPAATPAPAAVAPAPAPNPMAALGGVGAPTVIPQEPALSPPGSPGLPGGGGFKPGVAELMQMLMAAQGQNNAPPPSLGQAIVQR